MYALLLKKQKPDIVFLYEMLVCEDRWEEIHRCIGEQGSIDGIPSTGLSSGKQILLCSCMEEDGFQ